MADSDSIGLKLSFSFRHTVHAEAPKHLYTTVAAAVEASDEDRIHSGPVPGDGEVRILPWRIRLSETLAGRYVAK